VPARKTDIFLPMRASAPWSWRPSSSSSSSSFVRRLFHPKRKESLLSPARRIPSSVRHSFLPLLLLLSGRKGALARLPGRPARGLSSPPFMHVRSSSILTSPPLPPSVDSSRSDGDGGEIWNSEEMTDADDGRGRAARSEESVICAHHPWTLGEGERRMKFACHSSVSPKRAIEAWTL